LIGFLLKALAFLYTIGVIKNVSNIILGRIPRITEQTKAK